MTKFADLVDKVMNESKAFKGSLSKPKKMPKLHPKIGKPKLMKAKMRKLNECTEECIAKWEEAIDKLFTEDEVMGDTVGEAILMIVKEQCPDLDVDSPEGMEMHGLIAGALIDKIKGIIPVVVQDLIDAGNLEGCKEENDGKDDDNAPRMGSGGKGVVDEDEKE